MRSKLILLATIPLAACCAGCSTIHRKNASASAAVEATITPAIQVTTPPAAQPARPAVVDDAPLPVWKPTRIVKVRVAPYLNERGEAFPESYKYVVAEEGSWNLSALHNPERAYIPAENSLKPASAPGTLTGLASPGTAMVEPRVQGVPARMLYDMSQIRITGFFERKDENKARTEAEKIKGEIGPFTVGYDADLGWLILPQTAVLPSPDATPSAGLAARIPVAAQSRPVAGAGDKDIR